MRRRPVSDVLNQLQPWKRLGFVIVLVSGLLLTWSEPVRLYRSPSFWVKIALFALVDVAFRAVRVRRADRRAHVFEADAVAVQLARLQFDAHRRQGLIAFDASFDG